MYILISPINWYQKPWQPSLVLHQGIFIIIIIIVYILQLLFFLFFLQSHKIPAMYPSITSSKNFLWVLKTTIKNCLKWVHSRQLLSQILIMFTVLITTDVVWFFSPYLLKCCCCCCSSSTNNNNKKIICICIVADWVAVSSPQISSTFFSILADLNITK